MPRIHALIPTFNASESILNCLKSLDDKVNEIVVLDGRWIGVNGYSLHSIDGTIEKVIEWGINAKSKVKLMLAKEHQVHQVDARNQLISAVPDGDYFLFIDSDEIIAKWNPKIDDNQIGYRIRMTTEKIFKEKSDFSIPFPIPRFMKKINGIRFTRNHRYVENNDGAIFMGDLPLIEVVLASQTTSETKAMRKTMRDYEAWLFKYEQEQEK